MNGPIQGNKEIVFLDWVEISQSSFAVLELDVVRIVQLVGVCYRHVRVRLT